METEEETELQETPNEGCKVGNSGFKNNKNKNKALNGCQSGSFYWIESPTHFLIPKPRNIISPSAVSVSCHRSDRVM